MNMTWNLEIMYKGYDDPKYIKDNERVLELIKELNDSVKKLNKENAVNCIEKNIKLEEEFNKVIMELFSYSSLRAATNVNDYEALGEMGKLQMVLQETVEASVLFTKFLKDLDLDELAKQSDVIKTYLFILKSNQEEAKHMLSDKEEILASKLRLVGSNSWGDLQGQLTANLSIKVEGFEENMPLSAVRNLAYDHSEKVRKAAYEAELGAYKQIEDSVAMALNNIKREVNIMMPLRGYEDALDKTLKQSRMSKATLDAMIAAIKEEAPKFREYFKLKAKALGHKNGLPFYDLFAPMGSMHKTYTIEEAKDLVLDVYGSFSKSLYELGREAFENRWIDVLPHEGKSGGAFCAGLDNHNESRVLTNFTGSLSDVQTLAHELGHAYHGRVVLDNAPLNRDYPMPLAETASIMCQTLMAKKMINDLTDPNELLTVVEESLQEDSQCVIDILSRFIFESKVLEQPIARPLSASDMCEFMLDAQDESYGDGLDPEYKHAYMWLCKSHYYSAGLNFYNWPYAFGLLFGKGLYKQYLKDKEKFVKNYDQMLRNTGFMSVEDVAAFMNIDVTKKDFWIESLKFIEEDIDLFEKLLKETKAI
ncbi:MAG: M3 family oligoendopeptidase [Erysipelotrichaceae bacterium]|nr:M3 family oligoendopeptidase [Erysipelotrichaceae bacterium]